MYKTFLSFQTKNSPIKIISKKLCFYYFDFKVDFGVDAPPEMQRAVHGLPYAIQVRKWGVCLSNIHIKYDSGRGNYFFPQVMLP